MIVESWNFDCRCCKQMAFRCCACPVNIILSWKLLHTNIVQHLPNVSEDLKTWRNIAGKQGMGKVFHRCAIECAILIDSGSWSFCSKCHKQMIFRHWNVMLCDFVPHLLSWILSRTSCTWIVALHCALASERCVLSSKCLLSRSVSIGNTEDHWIAL